MAKSDPTKAHEFKRVLKQSTERTAQASQAYRQASNESRETEIELKPYA